MMSKPQSQKKELRRFLLAIPVLAALFFVFSCEITPEEEMEGPIMAGEIKEVVTIGSSISSVAARKKGKDGQEVFKIVDDMPLPDGGMTEWGKYLGSTLKYPEEAKRMGMEGTVIVGFTVNTDGSLSDIEVLRGVGGSLDEEAIRAIENAPNWTPGKVGGVEVNTLMRLPIRFKLDGNEESTKPVNHVTVDFPAVIEVPDSE